ncbi:hypothetical protein QR680_010044 [Steinernema hermaphroditum]|uniref:7TM GPCR serpentine receptor class x (Srx) domain-containing protein n=1 Tax=Steinernema hermaphroditum TaxID=289476 RepID=A0AA39IMH8_9BILA|nr:hypothetical protein QR680_010044 [Steinernema hermaphroditum]
MVPPLQTAVGITYIVTSSLFTPNYVRIICIFLKHKKYRSLECYRIMIQMGIIQCAMAPGIFLEGVAQLVNVDFLHLGTFFIKAMIVGIRAEGIVGFALALNRLKILLSLEYPSLVHTMILVFAWLFYCVHYGLLLTPLADFPVVPGVFIAMNDLTKPYSALINQVGGLIYESVLCLTLIVYLVIITFLVYTKLKSGLSKKFRNEFTILAYAGIRFLLDMGLSIVFHYVRLPQVSLTGFVVCTCYIINCFLVPPVLYLCLHRTLRREFFNMKEEVKLFTVTSMASQLAKR